MNFVCWVYGSDPGKFEGGQLQDILGDRASSCHLEVEDINEQMDSLLEDVWKG